MDINWLILHEKCWLSYLHASPAFVPSNKRKSCLLEFWNHIRIHLVSVAVSFINITSIAIPKEVHNSNDYLHCI